MSLSPDSEIFALNSGFTKVELDKYVKEIAKLKDIRFEINCKKVFDLINGNSYLASAFMETEGSTFELKYDNFIKERMRKMKESLKKCFSEKFKSYQREFEVSIAYLISYLDNDKSVLPDDYITFIDKNFTYIDRDGYLKSVNHLARKAYMEVYLAKLQQFDPQTTHLKEVLSMCRNEGNPSLQEETYSKKLFWDIFLLENLDSVSIITVCNFLTK